MHAYSTNESRVPVYSILAIIALVVAWIIGWLTSLVEWPQWIVGAPSFGAVFAGTYRLFDLRIWHTPLARRLGLVMVEDLNGSYEGELVSTFKDSSGKQVEREIRIDILQTWTHISVDMKVSSGTSSSTSTSALGSVTRDGGSTRLAYIYRNRVNPGLADADMGDHDGAAELDVDLVGRMTGRYYNSRPRAGTIQVERVSTAPLAKS